MAAAVLDVAVLAGVGVEQRAEAIAGGGGGRGDHPGVAEEAVADAEVQAPRSGERLAEGREKAFWSRLLTGGAAASRALAGFGRGEARWSVFAGAQRQGQ